MRNRLGWITLCLAATLAAPAAAQEDSTTAESLRSFGVELSGGLRGGAALSTFVNVDYDTRPRAGFRGGGFLELRVTPTVSAVMEAVYVMKGVTSNTLTFGVDYLELPLLAQLRFAEHALSPRLFAGPALAFRVRPASWEGMHSTDFAGVVGAGMETGLVGLPVLLDIRYTRGFSPIFDYGPDDNDSDDLNQTLSVGLGIRLF